MAHSLGVKEGWGFGQTPGAPEPKGPRQSATLYNKNTAVSFYGPKGAPE